jgi:F-type H+-transporting ATPase subunit gamma
MSNTTALYRRKIGNAEDLQSVVRTMKALAATSIGQYENSVRALAQYYRAVELGLGVCIRGSDSIYPLTRAKETDEKTLTVAIVFGSDQGLVGQFNDAVSVFVVEQLNAMPGTILIWAVGERVHAQLEAADLEVTGLFRVPGSVKSIAPLVTQIQLKCDAVLRKLRDTNLYLFYNRPLSGSLYEPVKQRLLPFDSSWQQRLANVNWPTRALPELIVNPNKSLPALIREYLFISIFRACAESLASENASRLSAMERADKNIEETLENLRVTFNRLRQRSIDEELFDVTAGFEALVGPI